MASNEYPLTKFYFSVDWGRGDMSFQEVSGLEMTREKAEYRGGLDMGFIKRQIPGMKKAGDLTLKKGVFAGNSDFFKWWNGTNEDPLPERRDVTIILRDSASKPVMTWTVSQAFPTKVSSSELNAEKNEIAIETLVLTHEGIKVES